MTDRKVVKVSKSSAIRFNATQLVTIHVGEDDSMKTFAAHKDIICAKSAFFRKALNGRWEESKGVVNLPHEDPAIFEIWLNYLYTAQLAIADDNAPSAQETLKGVLADEYLLLFKLHVLCEMLLDDSTKDVSTAAIFGLSFRTGAAGETWNPGQECLNLAYKRTAEGSVLRRLIVDLWTKVEGGHIRNLFEKLPKEFLSDLAIALLQAKMVPNIAKKNGLSTYLTAAGTKENKKKG